MTGTDTIAADLLAALDNHHRLETFTSRLPGFDLAAAYRVTAALRRLRTERGERVVGRKLGFTNRTIWPEFGVYAPIWGDMFDTTVHEIGTEGAVFELKGLAEPKIEPEIAFGLARAPEPGMDESRLMGCIGWVAHGIEVVQSLYPGWAFEAPDTVAAFAMHGAYLIGPRRPVTEAARAEWQARLGNFSLTLFRDGAPVARGRASDVLDGPLSALRHLVELLKDDPDNPPLVAGEIVTTGTVTRALDIRPGETWNTRLEGLDLPGLTVSFS
jgi:2-oxo-3-hexenedioate decarboxylase